MNERINELFEQALEEFSVGNKYATIIVPNPLKEKFADLIVDEAIAVVQRRFMGDLNREDLEVRRCVEELKLHFGVEL
jgi:hypothetical protein